MPEMTKTLVDCIVMIAKLGALTEEPDAKKLAACACADNMPCIVSRYSEIRCADCDADLSKRKDWEPFLGGLARVTPVTRLNEPAEMVQSAMCYACLDKCGEYDACEFNGTMHTQYMTVCS